MEKFNKSLPVEEVDAPWMHKVANYSYCLLN